MWKDDIFFNRKMMFMWVLINVGIDVIIFLKEINIIERKLSGNDYLWWSINDVKSVFVKVVVIYCIFDIFF